MFCAAMRSCTLLNWIFYITLFVHTVSTSFVPPLGIERSVEGPQFIVPVQEDSPLFRITADVDPNPIEYHIGAPVMTNDVHIRLIWYGNWSDERRGFIESFLSNLGASDWYKVNHKYYYQQNETSPKIYANGSLYLSSIVYDRDYSRGKNLTGNDVPLIIQGFIERGELPEDTDSLYLVLTADDVIEQSRPDLNPNPLFLCDNYCGYHVSWQLPSQTRIYYALAGLPSGECITKCAARPNRRRSPNGDIAADAIVSIIAHEIVEAVSDPESDGRRAWEDLYQNENGDKCAWKFLNLTMKDGYAYNMEIGGKKLLIQANWDPETQDCALAP